MRMWFKGELVIVSFLTLSLSSMANMPPGEQYNIMSYGSVRSYLLNILSDIDHNWMFVAMLWPNYLSTPSHPNPCPW